MNLEIATRWVDESQDELRKMKIKVPLSSAFSLQTGSPDRRRGEGDTRRQQDCDWVWGVQQCTKSSRSSWEGVIQVHQVLLSEDDFFLLFSGQNPRLSALWFTLHAVMVNYLCILITESAGCNLKITSTSKPCNGFSTLFHVLDGACAFSLMDLSMEEEF